MKTELEIEKKFFVPESHTLRQRMIDIIFVKEKRYYLYRRQDNEIRFASCTSQNGEVTCTLDRMILQPTSNSSHIVRQKERLIISLKEYQELEQLVAGRQEPIIRDHYHLTSDPKCELKVYQGKFAKLIRAEVEFETVEEAVKYVPLFWFGKEITDSHVGRDTLLPDLSLEEFASILKNLNSTS